MAWIWRCCGCGVGQQLQLRFNPLAWEPPYTAGAALKRQNKQTNKNITAQRRQRQMDISIQHHKYELELL